MDVDSVEIKGQMRPEIGFEEVKSQPKETLYRSKSSLRIKYEAEKQVLEQQLGSLEEIRERLGLSQRKMAQLLLVDPSAWTRWIKDPSKVPPHVYRALQWYLELTEKKPEWRPENSFGPLTQQIEVQTQPESSKKHQELSLEINYLKSQLKESHEHLFQIRESIHEQQSSFAEKVDNKDTALAIWKLFVLLNSIVLFFWFVWNLI